MSLSSPDIINLRERPRRDPIGAFLLGGAVAFFIGSLMSDWAYFHTNEIQWKNFVSWLLMGGLVFGGLGLLWMLVELVRTHGSRQRGIIFFVLMLAVWILGFLNELVHAKDAFASMPEGLIISFIVVVLAIAATVLGLSTLTSEGR
jgi:uncharacterized membrane protein